MSNQMATSEKGRLHVAMSGVVDFSCQSLLHAVDNLPTVVMVFLYVAMGAYLTHETEAIAYSDIFNDFIGYSGACFSLLLIALPIGSIAFGRPDKPFAAIKDSYFELLSVDAWQRGAWLVLSFGSFAAVFMHVKSLLGVWAFADMDPILSQIDCTITFGCPQNWLLPTIVSPEMYFFLSVIYDIGWFVLTMSFMGYLALLAPAGRLRSRTIFAYLAAWIFPGTILAWLGFSGGPVFYALMTGQPGPYGHLVHTLRLMSQQVPFSSMTLVNRMTAAYTAGKGIAPPGLGLSAMPSMHIAMVAIIAFYARHFTRWAQFLAYLALAFFCYAAIALGWHYGVDVYVALASSALIWWLSGYLSFDLSSCLLPRLARPNGD